MKIDWNEGRNLSMLTDFYEFTMGNAFMETGKDDDRLLRVFPFHSR